MSATSWLWRLVNGEAGVGRVVVDSVFVASGSCRRVSGLLRWKRLGRLERKLSGYVEASRSCVLQSVAGWTSTEAVVLLGAGTHAILQYNGVQVIVGQARLIHEDNVSTLGGQGLRVSWLHLFVKPLAD